MQNKYSFREGGAEARWGPCSESWTYEEMHIKLLVNQETMRSRSWCPNVPHLFCSNCRFSSCSLDPTRSSQGHLKPFPENVWTKSTHHYTASGLNHSVPVAWDPTHVLCNCHSIKLHHDAIFLFFRQTELSQNLNVLHMLLFLTKVLWDPTSCSRFTYSFTFSVYISDVKTIWITQILTETLSEQLSATHGAWEWPQGVRGQWVSRTGNTQYDEHH